MPDLRTADGSPIVLGDRLGAGGEGTVYICGSRPKQVVKIYNAPMESERQKKLREMYPLASKLPDDLRAITAWPTDVVVDKKNVVGFVMPRVESAEEIHVLYGPKSRKQQFPGASFKFLVHVAMNVARAFHVIHREGLIVGDVNERLVMVARDGVTRVIDCDSFQWRGPSGTYFCDVGVAGYTPPELQDVSLRGLQRTTQHDVFGLAVMIFHILFMGRHPFAGRYHKPDEMPLEKAIKECRFAYSSEVSRTQMYPPPNTPLLDMSGQTLAVLFERAFSPDAAAGRVQRPSAKEWADGLEALQGQLVVCKTNAAHAHAPNNQTCPFCQVEATTGLELFHYVEPSGAPYVQVDINLIWQAISGLSWPSPANEIDLVSARQAAALSREALLITQAQNDTKALSDAAEAVIQAQLAVARAEETVKVEVSNVRKTSAALASFDEEERANSELGQEVTRSLARGRLYGSVAGFSTLALILVPAAYILHQLGGVVLGSVLGAVALSNSVRGVLLKSKARRLAAQKQILFDALRGGLAGRVDRHKAAEQMLSNMKARLSKVQGELYMAMASKSSLEAKVKIEQEAIESAKVELLSRHRRVHQTYEVWRRQRLNLVQELNQAQKRFSELRSEAQALISDVKRIDQMRRFERERVAGQEKENQLNAYLDTFFIAKADWGRTIPRTVLSTLSSYGIETAADIEREKVEAVPGFGKTRTQALLDWKSKKKAGFRFNPTQVSTANVAAVDRHFLQLRRAEDRKLNKVKEQVDMLIGPLASRCQHLNQELASITPAYGQMLLEEEAILRKAATPQAPTTPAPPPKSPLSHSSATSKSPTPSPAWSWKSKKPKRRRRRP